MSLASCEMYVSVTTCNQAAKLLKAVVLDFLALERVSRDSYYFTSRIAIGSFCFNKKKEYSHTTKHVAQLSEVFNLLKVFYSEGRAKSIINLQQ